LSNFISVLLAVYNGEKFIAESIESVIGQEFRNWELIIVDNGSSDNTSNIVNSYCDADARIRLFNLKEKGKCNAYNFAFSKSSGDFICFFAADDILTPNNLFLRLYAIMGKGQLLYSTILLKTFSENKKFDGLVFPKNINSPNFSGGSIFFTRELAQFVFPIPVFLPNEDTWTSLCLKTFGINVHIPEALYLYRIHSNNSNGYDLEYTIKRAKFLSRMKAYELFNERFSESSDVQSLKYIKEFIRGVRYCENNNRVSILFNLNLPLKDKFILFYYSTKVLYNFRQFFFKLTSGILN
jgi:glycosyltransferase involved in cell wall biosynthesis